MWGWWKFCSTKKGSQNRFWCHVMQLNLAQARNFSAHFNPNQLKEAREKCANQNTKFYHNASANIHQVNSSWHLYPHQKVVWARTAFIPTPFHKKKTSSDIQEANSLVLMKPRCCNKCAEVWGTYQLK